MTTGLVSHRTSATQSNESPTSGGRDARKGAQTDASTDQTNNPPVPTGPTHGFGRFLWETDPTTPIKNLAAAYDAWQGEHNGGDAT